MNILVLGGTKFVGRAFVEAALADGHTVTLVHRGRTGAGLFPESEHVLLDRNEGYAPLAGRSFDAVVDVSAYVPRVAGQAARDLKAQRYLFVSTVSVYDKPLPPRNDEDSPLLPPVDDTEEVTGETYGGLKVACEREVFAARPEAEIIRPGIIAGAYDPTNRLPYWVRRFSQAKPGADEEIVLPMHGDQPIQLVDARDLAAFMLLRLKTGSGGVFNVVGPDETIANLFSILSSRYPDAKGIPIPDLEAKGVAFGRDLPLVLAQDGSQDSFFRVGCARAKAAGLVQRPLEETIEDTVQWLAREDPMGEGAKYGMLTAEREREILSLAR